MFFTLMAGPLLSQQQTAPDATSQASAVFSGGALEGVRKASENAPFTTMSRTYVNLPGASVSWFVPANDTDLLNVFFSAECRLINSNITAANQDWVELRVQLTRVPAAAGFPTFMQPYDVGSPMAFCSANGYAMHAANFAARVAGGTTGATYIAQVQIRVADNGPADPTLTAWIDDRMLELLAFN
jgi:hypothetical protein